MNIHLFFDGGGSDDYAYGSWEVQFYGLKKRVHRQEYKNLDRVYLPEKLTSNSAEYTALIMGLEWLEQVKEKEKYHLTIRGDSMLVINQTKGQWRCRFPHLQELRQRVLVLLKGWPSHELKWNPRKVNMAIFGH